MMVLSLSDGLLQKLGYRPLASGELVIGSFHSLHVYEVRGLTPGNNKPIFSTGLIDGIPFNVAYGSSINQLCLRLVNDSFAENEDEWRKEHKTAPPYLIVHFGPTENQTGTGTHIKTENTKIYTYDSFRAARDQFTRNSSIVLPKLISALSINFCSTGKRIVFRFLEIVMFGMTKDGQTVHDLRFMGSASGYASEPIEQNELINQLDSSVKLAGQMNKKFAEFYHLGLVEEDSLKRFLFLFLAIEIQTHATFSSISFHECPKLILAPDRIANSATAFFDEQRKKSTNIRDRFIWCAIYVWENLTDWDVKQFKKLKEVRDKIAHGSISFPKAEDVVAAEKLAAKLNYQKNG